MPLWPFPSCDWPPPALRVRDVSGNPTVANVSLLTVSGAVVAGPNPGEALVRLLRDVNTPDLFTVSAPAYALVANAFDDTLALKRPDGAWVVYCPCGVLEVVLVPACPNPVPQTTVATVVFVEPVGGFNATPGFLAVGDEWTFHYFGPDATPPAHTIATLPADWPSGYWFAAHVDGGGNVWEAWYVASTLGSWLADIQIVSGPDVGRNDVNGWGAVMSAVCSPFSATLAVATDTGSSLGLTVGPGHPEPAGVTSVNVSGGTTGFTVTGGPVTGSGVLTLGGVLSISHGGTGATTATTAINNLLPNQSGKGGDVLFTDGTNPFWGPISVGVGVGVTLGELVVGNTGPGVLAVDSGGHLTEVANGAGVLTNDGSGSLSWQPPGPSLDDVLGLVSLGV